MTAKQWYTPRRFVPVTIALLIGKLLLGACTPGTVPTLTATVSPRPRQRPQ